MWIFRWPHLHQMVHGGFYWMPIRIGVHLCLLKTLFGLFFVIIRSYSWNLFGGLLYARILRRRWERSTICAADRQLKSIHKLIIITRRKYKLYTYCLVDSFTHTHTQSELEWVGGGSGYKMVHHCPHGKYETRRRRKITTSHHPSGCSSRYFHWTHFNELWKCYST